MPHNALSRELLEADYRMKDPGDAGTIALDRNFGVMPLVTVSADALKTRSLVAPLKAGMRLTLYFKTDGGDCVVTSTPDGVDQSGNTVMTFADAGDYINFESIEEDATYVWRVIGYDGVAGVSVGATATTTHVDDNEEKFGTGNDWTFDFDGTNMKILPKTDDTGALHIGNGTLDADMKWWSDAAFVDFNHGTKIVEFDAIDLKLGDNDSINFGDKAGNGDFTIKFDTTNLQILPDVDDTGAVHIGDGTLNCDFKWFGAGGGTVEFNAGNDTVNFAGTDLKLGDSSNLAVGAGSDLYLTSDGTHGSIDNSDGGNVLIGDTNAAAVQLGKAAGGTFIKSRLVGFQGALPVFTNTGTLADSDMLAGIVRGQPTAAASWTLRTGTQFETALVAIVGAIATNDTFDMVIVNEAGTTTWDITLIDAAVAGMTIIGNPVVGALADVATEQESQGTFRFRRTAANTFDVIRVA